MSSVEKNGKIFVVIAFVSFFVIAYLVNFNRKKTIKSNMKVNSGYIYECNSAFRGGVDIFYSVVINGNTVKGSRSLGITSSYRNFFEKKWFPVVYNADEPTENKILIKPIDFEDYGIEFPDSLNWVKKYCN